MKKVNIILLIISVIIIVLGILIALGTSNELLNLTGADVIDSVIGERYSAIIEIFGIFGAKIVKTMIIIFSIVIDILIWIVYGVVLLCMKIIKKIKEQ